jgi:hypothetical protein
MSQALTTESVRVIFRGSRDGMLWKILNPVLETRYGDVYGTSTGAYRAGIVESAGDWQWSSHQSRIGIVKERIHNETLLPLKESL